MDIQTSVPLVDLTSQLVPIRDEIDEAIRRVIDSGYFILGGEVESFEQEIASYVGCQHAVGVSSGTDALLVALMAVDIRPGDEVVTTPFSFFATAGCIDRLGARPIFVDIDPVTFNLDAKLIEAVVTPRTSAIIPVHLYGQCADMTEINKVAEKYGLEVVEDAAQAIGADYQGRRAGGLGHLGCFSFFPTKNLGAMGDGGLVTTDDKQLA
ncbi:MAG: DegT/DnrJ/EryC1/StrS family aminotransferase, partial [Planctomycetales bacterium]